MTIAVRRARLADEAGAWAILEEYNTTFDVVVRDDLAALRKYLDGPGAFGSRKMLMTSSGAL